MMTPVFERLPDLVNANADLVRRGRFFAATFLVQRGETPYLVRVVEGRVERVERGPFLMRDWRFAIRASEAAWEKFTAPVPEAGYQDIFAMAKFGHALIEGDLLLLMQNLRYVQDVLGMARSRQQHGGSDARSPQAPHRQRRSGAGSTGRPAHSASSA